MYPPGRACYLCAIPFDTPINHAFPSPAPATMDPNACEYGDILKPLAWHIFDTAAIRGEVFMEMGLPVTMMLATYSRGLGQMQPGGLLNLYELAVTVRRRGVV